MVMEGGGLAEKMTYYDTVWLFSGGVSSFTVYFLLLFGEEGELELPRCRTWAGRQTFL